MSLILLNVIAFYRTLTLFRKETYARTLLDSFLVFRTVREWHINDGDDKTELLNRITISICPTLLTMAT